MKKYLAGDFLIAAEIVIIGLAGATHLAAIILGWTFTNCTWVFGVLVCVAAVLGGGYILFRRRAFWGKGASPEKKEARSRRGEGCYYAVFVLLFLSQLVFICIGDTNCRTGDMTVETVGSFLEEDGLYMVNPMTGAPYTGGIPFRLKILCLPTLYACLVRVTGLSAGVVVWKLVPIVTLISCYTAFGLLAAALFPEEEGSGFGEKRACFMTIASLLVWVGAYQAGIDGFQLLCGGWRGVTIRNLVLIPWLLSLCLRRRWLTAILCILAEACMVWTLYGCGMCLPVLLGMAGIKLCYRFAEHRRAQKV